MFLGWGPDIALDSYPFVVIGAGPAGLYLAQQLSKQGKVLVVEAGALDDAHSPGDDFYELKSTGISYPTLGTRLSSFGGTSNHWGGHSRPFSREVFTERRSMPRWPIGYDDFAPYLDGARRFMRVDAFDPPTNPLSILTGVLGDYAHLTATQFRYSSPMLRLGDDASVAAMRSNPDIDVLMDVRLADLELAAGNARVEAMTLLHRPSRETRKVSVGQVFLCAGGIETARMMLWAGRKYAKGNPLLGGPNELVGQYFTEKPNFWPVELFIDSRADFADAFSGPDHPSDYCWELTEEFRTQHGLPRFGVFPNGKVEVAEDEQRIEVGSTIYAGHSARYVKVDPAFQFEQTPHTGSYVRLADERDGDGIARAELHWTISKEDTDAYRRAVLLFCGVLSQKGMARAWLRPPFQAEDWSEIHIEGCCHHIGTTRMAASAQDGVVDANCRVFGLDNLYVAGSSVFPSADYVNPTLNLVALAGRLADQVLKSRV